MASAVKHPSVEIDAMESAIQRLRELRAARHIAIRHLDKAFEAFEIPGKSADGAVADAE